MTQVEIDEALERSDEINELQDTRVLAAAYRQEKALLATMTEAFEAAFLLAAPRLEAERDAAAESCRLMQDRVERLVEANLGLQARIDDDEWRKVYEIERDNARRLYEDNLLLRGALERIEHDSHHMMAQGPLIAHMAGIARAALGKEVGE